MERILIVTNIATNVFSSDDLKQPVLAGRGLALAIVISAIVGLCLAIFWIWFPITTWRQLRELNRNAEETNKLLRSMKYRSDDPETVSGNNPFR